MTMSYENLSIALVVALGAITIVLYRLIWQSQIRADFLQAAKMASSDFYDRADLLLRDPATPEPLKDMIFDIGLAVTDERAGRRAMSFLTKSLADIKHRGHVTTPRKEFLDLLDELRRSRGDLYDTFHEALGAAIASILLSHSFDIDRAKIALSYDAIGSNRSKLLSLAESLDQAITGWGRRGQDNSQAACA
ncbi:MULTISPECIES: hypothetical protein [Rhodomicrobium]|uniref:hypothetical protein n=1 Tax=Rhodomicrobium TaxID=1068 RepID=UPI000F742771|nr:MULTISPECIES: hypothetical protein [Rhodomicrobium]